MAEMADTVMDIQNLTKAFTSGFGAKTNAAPAVNDVSFSIRKGRFISLIGESGSGKTTVGKMIMRLLQPTSGTITFNGNDIQQYRSSADLKTYYREVQSIFQDPFSSFNPLFKIDRVFRMVIESFLGDKKAAWDKVLESIDNVGMNPKEILGKYPHQLSGGQLQRLLIARSLLMEVKVLVADELISMLDASTRIDVLNLLGSLAYDKGMSVLFITHDLSLGYYISEETLIMYKGRLVEDGLSTEVFARPVHPYTKMLLASVPDISRRWNKASVFLPEAIQHEVSEFYVRNAKEQKGLIQISEGHRAILTL